MQQRVRERSEGAPCARGEAGLVARARRPPARARGSSEWALAAAARRFALRLCSPRPLATMSASVYSPSSSPLQHPTPTHTRPRHAPAPCPRAVVAPRRAQLLRLALPHTPRAPRACHERTAPTRDVPETRRADPCCPSVAMSPLAQLDPPCPGDAPQGPSRLSTLRAALLVPFGAQNCQDTADSVAIRLSRVCRSASRPRSRARRRGLRPSRPARCVLLCLRIHWGVRGSCLVRGNERARAPPPYIADRRRRRHPPPSTSTRLDTRPSPPHRQRRTHAHTHTRLWQ